MDRRENRREALDRRQQAISELKRRGLWGYVEPVLTMGSAIFAEPVSGMVGLAALPYGADAATNAINRTQQALTYQPRTEEGQSAMQAVGEFMQPVGDAFIGASEYLGDAAYEATGSPALGAAAYSVPTMALEAIGLKGAKHATRGHRAFEVGDIGKQGSQFGGKQRGIFAGIKARGADLDAQAAAAELARRGVDRKEIWQKTGWFEDVDGNWKWEIDDTKYYHGTASEIKEIDPSKFGSATDAHSAKQGFWQSNSPDTAESYANFAARDAKIQKLIRQADAAGDAGDWDLYDDLIVEAEGLERESAAFKGQNIMPSYVAGKTKEIDMKGADFMDEQDYINQQISLAKREGYDSLKLKRLIDDAGLVGRESDHIITFNPDKVVSKFDADLYQQPKARMNMTPEQRRATAPWETLDVPEGELIVKREGGVMQSIPENPNAWFHGSPSQEYISKLQSGAERGWRGNGNAYGDGIYITRSPKTASEFAGDSGQILPLTTQAKMFAPSGNVLDDATAAKLDEWINTLNEADLARLSSDIGIARKSILINSKDEAKSLFDTHKKNWEYFGGIQRTKPSVNKTDQGFVIEYTDFNAKPTFKGKTGNEALNALIHVGGKPTGDALKYAGFEGVRYLPDEAVIFDSGNVKSIFEN